ncbi:MAG: Glycosyltransferase, group 2 family protein [Succiniclasticum sp.]|jgi:hypothetical protein
MNDVTNPLISVIMPVYNVERLLEKSVQSVVLQDYQNLEIILVDDGSTDKSGLLCDKFAEQDCRIKIIHKKNGGLSDARNVGIRSSRGMYITLVDSDDEIDRDCISYLYSLIERYHCPMSLCTHRIYYERSDKTVELGNHEECKLDAKTCIRKMCYHDQVDTSAWGKLYQRDLFSKIEYPVGKKFEDIGTTYKLFIQSKIIACGFSPKYTYHIRENSITTSSFNLSKLDLLEMTDQMAKDVVQLYQDLKKAVLRRQVYARLSTINQTLTVDDFSLPIRDEMIEFVKNHSWQILQDQQAPLRDKIAIILLLLGLPAYRFAWNLYSHLKM